MTHPAQLVFHWFHCIAELVVFCCLHLIGPSEPEGLNDDIGVSERQYCGVLYI